MAQNGELLGLPWSAALSTLHTFQRRSQPIIIVIPVIPNSAVNVVPFTHSLTHTHSHMHAEVEKKKDSPPPLQLQHMGSRKEVGGFEEKKKKGPQEGSEFLLGPCAADLARQVDTRPKKASISTNTCFESSFVHLFVHSELTVCSVYANLLVTVMPLQQLH